MRAKPYKQAVIVGGSIAGLLTARVLSESFEEVVVLERDDLTSAPSTRSGVPQGHHIHAVLTAGRLIFERLFPGIVDEVVGDGALLIDHIKDRKRLAPYGWQPRFSSDLHMLLITRGLLEAHVRRRAAAVDNIRIESGAWVQGFTGDTTAVTGVRVTPATDADGFETIIQADLVVDAGGRRSNAPDWLEELGFDRPEEDLVDARWGYASRFFKMPDTWSHDWNLINMWPQLRVDGPQKTRGGVLCQQDGGRCIVTLVGNSGDLPPKDEAGFLAFASSLTSPEIADFIRSAEPVSPITISRTTINRFRRYDRMVRKPERFVAIGDAVGAFNPVYGQGMTAAALSAEQVGLELERWVPDHGGDLTGFAPVAQAAVVKVLEFPWRNSTASDSKIDGCEGSLEQDPTVSAYVERVVAATSQDRELVRKLEEMANLTRNSDWMFEDDVKKKVIAQWDELGQLVGAPAMPAPVPELIG